MRPLRGGIPHTVLSRRRRQASGVHKDLEAAALARAEALTERIREQLLALRRRLPGLHAQRGTRTPLVVPRRVARVARTSRRGEDSLLTGVALLVTATLGLSGFAMLGRDIPSAPPLLRVDEAIPDEALNARIVEIAEAIAMAEGYYDPGVHAGRSLPFRLNNPGGLKKPALGAALLPMWRDTGLVQFPTSDMGWAALRHQVRLMLTGNSRVYRPSDDLLLVAEKYADGDLNWGRNVARNLGVRPLATLEELARDRSVAR